MEQRFQEYGQRVCAHIRHATFEEKRLIKKELADHLEDHAQALMDAGYGEDDALDMALESMGDPEEVGKELHKEYPFRWLLLSRLLMGVLGLLAVYYLFLLPLWWPGHLIDYFQVRLDPAGHHDYQDAPAEIHPLDIRWELPDGDVLCIYGLTLQDSRADLYFMQYSKNPFFPYAPSIHGLEFSYTLDRVETPCRFPHFGGYSGLSYSYDRYELTDLPKGCALTVRCQFFGTDFQAEIPLPWEEVRP